MLQLLCKFTNVTQIGSITEVASTLQESINNKMRYNKCKKCDLTGSNLEILLGTFNAIPSILAVELGHIPGSISHGDPFPMQQGSVYI